jgi:hypothetical protein
MSQHLYRLLRFKRGAGQCRYVPRPQILGKRFYLEGAEDVIEFRLSTDQIFVRGTGLAACWVQVVSGECEWLEVRPVADAGRITRIDYENTPLPRLPGRAS